jgi:hypothetical protein
MNLRKQINSRNIVESGDKYHKPDHHDVTEILLKAVINTINLTTTM